MTIVRSGGGFKVVSESSGRNLGGPFKSKAEAEKRLRQVEFFKHQGEASKRSVRGSKSMSNKEINKGFRKKTPKANSSQKAKVKKVLGEFKAGTLRGGAGKHPIVRDRNQAIAIALNQAGLSNQQRKSARGSRPFSDSEAKVGHRKLQTNLGTALTIPKQSMVSQIRNIQTRKYGTTGPRP